MDYKLPIRAQNSNKSTFGRVLNIAGSDYMPGAAYLSSVSALKIGCGYCFLCSTDRVIDAVAAQTQNVVFVPLNKLKDNIISSDVISIGCGLSLDNTAKIIFKQSILNIPKKTPLIIDADGLNLLSETSYKKMFLSMEFENVILTPHPKEAARLLNVETEDILNDLVSSATKIADIYKSVVVLKTHNTCVVSPIGEIYVNNTGNSALAKAGSGDVLTGMVSGLTAQGMNIFEAACTGVYLHGLCGEIASKKYTQYCVMAKDLITCIPDAINMLS